MKVSKHPRGHEDMMEGKANVDLISQEFGLMMFNVSSVFPEHPE